MENVKQNTMKYKILFIFSFILLSLLLFNTNVFASFDIEHNGTTYTIPDLPREKKEGEGILILKGNNSYHEYCVAYFPLSHDYISLYYKGSSTNLKFHSWYYNANSSSYESVFAESYSYKSGSWNSLEEVSIQVNPTYIYSDLDVIVVPYKTNVNEIDDIASLVVFQRPVQEITLAQVLVKTQEEIPELTLVEIAKIVTLILAVVVSLVGFRKAWKLLRTSLNRS